MKIDPPKGVLAKIAVSLSLISELKNRVYISGKQFKNPSLSGLGIISREISESI